MSWGTATVYIHVGHYELISILLRTHLQVFVFALQQRRRKIGRWAAQMLRGGHSTRTDLLQQQQSQKQQKEEGQLTSAADDSKEE
ncbi:unnamed protein product [Phytophthora lilii]|uniref:Unnamed protein product n=1 Tax=Phytophthora lilii TaxID=2077276 RepID=A0A9W6WNQ7_9STRA|nr:unnamed protein product [Phytophthora lilii]